MFTVKRMIRDGLVREGFSPKDASVLKTQGRLKTHVQNIGPGFTTNVQHISASIDGKEIVRISYISGDGGNELVDLEL